MQEQFDQDRADTFYDVLRKIALNPPGPSTISPALVKDVQIYLDSEEAGTPVSVWNFYKMLLDNVVRYALGSSFIIKLFDLEAFYKAPEGSYSQEAGNMALAPWRSGL